MKKSKVRRGTVFPAAINVLTPLGFAGHMATTFCLSVWSETVWACHWRVILTAQHSKEAGFREIAPFYCFCLFSIDFQWIFVNFQKP